MASVEYRALGDGLRIESIGDSVAYGGAYTANYPRLAEVEADTASWRYRFVKRSIDLLFSLAVLQAFFLPGLLIAAAIVRTSEGPVFYQETRIGKDGRKFRIWKFRTMRWRSDRQDSTAPSHSSQCPEPQSAEIWRIKKPLHDPRITAVGKFLRVWSLDEFPQFLNVLCGDMSLIGPRPIVEAELSMYGDQQDYYLRVKPGLSGLWQVSGRNNVAYEKRVELDAAYVKTWSLHTDFNILLRTIPAVLLREGSR
jgi:lipopolysaccharide/colanic/teichoic acid biosynthesis glycosyltransferase